MRSLTVILLLVLCAGCSRSVRVRSPQTQVPGVVTAWIKGFKANKRQFTASFYIRNEAGRRIVIKSEDVVCFRGGQQGEITTKPFNRSNVALLFKQGQRRGFKVRCTGGASRGDLQMVVKTVYTSDPSGNPGQPLVQNVVYAVTEKGRQASPVAVAPTVSGAAMAAAPPPPSGFAPPPPPPAMAPPPAAPVSVSPPLAARPSRSALPRIAPQPDWIIAIMEVDDVNSASRTMAIDPGLVRNIGDQLRIFVAERGVRTIDKSATERALQDIMQSIKKDSYKKCYDDNCQIELGKVLAASHILRTKITRFGSRCVLNAELIELRSEVAVTAASARGGCGAEGFLGMSERVASSITGR